MSEERNGYILFIGLSLAILGILFYIFFKNGLLYLDSNNRRLGHTSSDLV